MQRYLRFYIKFHGYLMAVAAIGCSILITMLMFQHNDPYYPLEEFYDYRFMGHAALLFGLAWFVIGVLMFYGIYAEKTKFLYPFIVLFMLDLFLLFIRDIALIWYNKPWYEIILLNPFLIVAVLVLTLHIMMCMVALGKLFEHDPLPKPGTNFVRFNTDNHQQASADDMGDEVMLVRN